MAWRRLTVDGARHAVNSCVAADRTASTSGPQPSLRLRTWLESQLSSRIKDDQWLMVRYLLTELDFGRRKSGAQHGGWMCHVPQAPYLYRVGARQWSHSAAAASTGEAPAVSRSLTKSTTYRGQEHPSLVGLSVVVLQ